MRPIGSSILKLLLCAAITSTCTATPASADSSVVVDAARALNSLNVDLSVADNLFNGTIDGRIVLMFAPQGSDPLDDTGVTSSPNKIFGKNALRFRNKNTITLSGERNGGANGNTRTGVYGWPETSLRDVPIGAYSVQAFFMVYETAKRSDGSVVSVHFPCGDGGPNVDGYGSITTSVVDVNVVGGNQTIALTFNTVEPVPAMAGSEIGGCSQGNYAETEKLKYIKIRSEALSKFWGRDMYVGANILLPYGYNAKDTSKRYPVIYTQGHWPGGRGAHGYPTAAFSAAWDNGTIPGVNGTAGRPAPKMILVQFRHESPYYDDSYGVNTANIGPYGDAINDELIPAIEKRFNTIPEPYARIQDGGSTGGWISIASVIFRPDLFGACFSSYPDSLDFHRHQDIHLYDAANAYVRDGVDVGSIRTFVNGTEVIQASARSENHWELTFGTSSRSFNQWDVWNAVYGIQGLNNYPLEPWDKVTGEIYPGAVEYWKHMDLAEHVVSNWDNSLNLGAALRGRIFLYVGEWDTYYLNEGVHQFQMRVDAAGGPGWANFTYLAQKPHGGNYNLLPIWDYLELVYGWIQDHGPNGTTPLLASATASSGRSNKFDDVLAYGGHQAALARQSPPEIKGGLHVAAGAVVRATAGRWDPGVTLRGQWTVNGQRTGQSFVLGQDQVVQYVTGIVNKNYSLQLLVTGKKRYYDTETRKSSVVLVGN